MKPRKVMYVGGVGTDRLFPLPVSGLRIIVGHKVMLLDCRDATELLKDERDYVLLPDDAAVDFDYTKPEETQIHLDNFVTNLQSVADDTAQKMVDAREERKILNAKEELVPAKE